MSGFLSRVAARAVGQAPVARPRVPSRFEGSAGDSGFEVVEAQVVAPQPARRESRRSASPPPAAPPSQPHEPRETLPLAFGTPDDAAPRRSPTAAPAEAPPASARPAHSAALPPASNRLLLAASRTEGSVAAADGEAVSAPVPIGAATEAVIAPVVVARPVPATAAIVGRSRPETAAALAATVVVEEPSVRVHIGRLEVRANLQQAPPERTIRSEPEPAGQSLADYLRGRRTGS